MKQELEIAIKAAIKAGQAIMKVYNSDDFGVVSKQDNSPLTKADRAGHNVISKYLSSTNIPLLSEEGRAIPFDERKNWNMFWLIDPLDGTKEFVKRNGEFTVNIALIKDNKPIMGVVYAPVLKTLYWASDTEGAWKKEGRKKPVILKKHTKQGKKTIVASRSHMNDETLAFLAQYPDAEIINIGSSLKLMLVAEGKADMYPRFGPTMEWDIAASHAICKEAPIEPT